MYALARGYAAAGDTKPGDGATCHSRSRASRSSGKLEAADDPAFETLRALPKFQRLIKR